MNHARLLILTSILLWVVPLAAQPGNEECLFCHEDDTLTLPLEDGDEMSLFIDPRAFEASVHGEALICTDCHAGYDEDHPSGATFESQRAYVIRSYELCKDCHFDTYTRTLESVHYELLDEGFDLAPVCSDCHGAHTVHDPHRKSAMVSESCGSCHGGIYETYLGSVHGQGLVGDAPDVPGCADCHTAHSIAHPDTLRFRLRSPEACLGCHGDAELARKYDMLTTVGTTYLKDFHGVTASLLADAEDDPQEVVVVCIDCHGYHDVTATDEIGKTQMESKVRAVCADCHEDAAPDFPAAWLSHFPPTLDHAPLVYLVNLFYRVFIPFMIAGLLLQVCLHLYRAGVRR